MSIKSHAFGRVTLTGKDAKTFQSQVRYGKATKAAVASVKRGVKLSREFEQRGKVTLKIRAAKAKDAVEA